MYSLQKLLKIGIFLLFDGLPKSFHDRLHLIWMLEQANTTLLLLPFLKFTSKPGSNLEIYQLIYFVCTIWFSVVILTPSFIIHWLDFKQKEKEYGLARSSLTIKKIPYSYRAKRNDMSKTEKKALTYKKVVMHIHFSRYALGFGI